MFLKLGPSERSKTGILTVSEIGRGRKREEDEGGEGEGRSENLFADRSNLTWVESKKPSYLSKEGVSVVALGME